MTWDDGWSTVGAPRPYAPEAEPARKVEGLTGEWSDAMAEARRMHEAAVAAEREPPRHRHARSHVLLGAVARGVGTALIAVGTFVVAAGMAVKGIGAGG